MIGRPEDKRCIRMRYMRWIERDPTSEWAKKMDLTEDNARIASGVVAHPLKYRFRFLFVKGCKSVREQSIRTG